MKQSCDSALWGEAERAWDGPLPEGRRAARRHGGTAAADRARMAARRHDLDRLARGAGRAIACRRRTLSARAAVADAALACLVARLAGLHRDARPLDRSRPVG